MGIKMKFVKHEQKWSQIIALSSFTHLAQNLMKTKCFRNEPTLSLITDYGNPL